MVEHKTQNFDVISSNLMSPAKYAIGGIGRRKIKVLGLSGGSNPSSRTKTSTDLTERG